MANKNFDECVSFLIDNGLFVGRICRLENVLKTIIAKHGYMKNVSAALSESTALAVLLANALKFEDMPNGQTRMVLTPWKCSECGVCVAACSNKGLDGMKLRQLTTLGPVSLHKCTKTLCKNCGKPIAPDSAEGLCSVCRIKERTKQRQEEARARAQKLKEEREAKKAAEEAAKAAEQAAAPAAEPAVEAAAPAAPQSVAAMLTDEAAAAAGAETAAAVPKTD